MELLLGVHVVPGSRSSSMGHRSTWHASAPPLRSVQELAAPSAKSTPSRIRESRWPACSLGAVTCIAGLRAGQKKHLHDCTRSRRQAVLEGNRGSQTDWGQFYEVVHKDGVSLRTGDDVTAGLTGEKLNKGEVFKIKSKVKRGSQLGLELLRGRGWAFAGKASQPLVREVAPPLTDVIFPLSVTGLDWVPAEGPNKRFLSLEGIRKQEAQALLTEAGVGIDDCLVMINQEPIYDMHFTRLLERMEVWTGLPRKDVQYYQVVTEGQYGIGLREEPALDAPRTGEDLLREAFFLVDSIVEDEDGMRYLHLEDDRGWALDNRLVDPKNPCVRELDEIKDGCTLTFWSGSPPDLFASLDPAFFEAPTQPLPAGWERATDSASDKVYYFNRATKQTSWTMPTAP